MKNRLERLQDNISKLFDCKDKYREKLQKAYEEGKRGYDLPNQVEVYDKLFENILYYIQEYEKLLKEKEKENE